MLADGDYVTLAVPDTQEAELLLAMFHHPDLEKTLVQPQGGDLKPPASREADLKNASHLSQEEGRGP